MKEQQILADFKAAINRELEKLRCETHPKICELRDKNIGRLRRMIANEIFSDKYSDVPSLQTVIASLETEL